MMSGYPSYPAYPAGTPGAPGAPGAQLQLAEPDPVQVAAAEPARQRRATVAFRLILVVPHMFLLFFLGIAALVVAFLGWWGALFTGRLPEFAVNYLSGFMRWVLRYQAYLYLLTDVYPPFTLDDVPEYPVRLAIPERQRLNRAAVFFRFILAIPGMIVSTVATEGASSLVLFVAWLIALVNGHLPRPLHQALTALLRYQIRFYCYYWMLTPAYPWGLFGDAAGHAARGPRIRATGTARYARLRQPRVHARLWHAGLGVRQPWRLWLWLWRPGRLRRSRRLRPGADGIPASELAAGPQPGRAAAGDPVPRARRDHGHLQRRQQRLLAVRRPAASRGRQHGEQRDQRGEQLVHHADRPG